MPEGGELKVTTRICPTNSTMVEIAVSDTGCGISAEELEKIFDPFYTTKATTDGTGLGLALCNEIIKRSHGSISVQSKPNEGSTFTVSIPFDNN
jgi:signal transduction histidine kinase